MYPVKFGYRIYKISTFSYIYCVEKDGKIIQIAKYLMATKYGRKSSEWEKLSVESYMLSMKTKISKAIKKDEGLRKIYEGRGNELE